MKWFVGQPLMPVPVQSQQNESGQPRVAVLLESHTD
jgi:hypothetical protein